MPRCVSASVACAQYYYFGAQCSSMLKFCGKLASPIVFPDFLPLSLLMLPFQL